MELHEHPFFSNVSSEELQPLLAAARLEAFGESTVIFEEGDEPDGIYLILEGEVVFRKTLPSGDRLVISQSSAGDHFGELGVLSSEPRSLQAEALATSIIVHIPGEALVEFLNKMEGPAEKILRSVIKHLHHTTSMYVHEVIHQEKMALVGGMMNSIIHDFKNPFCLISLCAQRILQLHPDPETSKVCNSIEQQIKRMVQMANELGDFSRGDQRLMKEPVPLLAMMEEFKQLNFLFFQNQKVRISVDLPDVVLYGEKGKLFRVFQNLIANAMDALEDSGGNIEIKGELQAGCRWVLIKITDNGKGIPAAIRKRLFEPFVTLGKTGGTGLGTAIVKSIIDAHGGTIDFTTAYRRGTTFFIRLPLHQDSPLPEA